LWTFGTVLLLFLLRRINMVDLIFEGGASIFGSFLLVANENSNCVGAFFIDKLAGLILEGWKRRFLIQVDGGSSDLPLFIVTRARLIFERWRRWW